jgi:hypothetical protein
VGAWGVAGEGRERARNVQQHGVGEWVRSVDFIGLEEVSDARERAEGIRSQLVEMGRGWERGYSLVG